MDEATKKDLSQNMYSEEIPRKLKIRYQIEFYFGDLNYFKDDYLLSCCDPMGYVPIRMISNFKRMK